MKSDAAVYQLEANKGSKFLLRANCSKNNLVFFILSAVQYLKGLTEDPFVWIPATKELGR